jgi:hypothetical protein
MFTFTSKTKITYKFINSCEMKDKSKFSFLNIAKLNLNTPYIVFCLLTFSGDLLGYVSTDKW